jgi:hypothetical protein
MLKTVKRRRRARRTPLDRALAGAMKLARKEKLAFEKRISAIVSEALGMEWNGKLKKPAAGSPAERRVMKAGSAKARDYYKRLDILSSPSAPLDLDAVDHLDDDAKRRMQTTLTSFLNTN